MAEKNKESKVILEREYVVPLRKKFMNTPQYKRTPKAVKALKEFIAKHMKVEDRDLKKVRIDKYLNLEFWMRGIRKPPVKIKVKAKKFDDGIVRVELAEIPQFLKWKIDREKRRTEMAGKGKPEPKKEEKKEEAPAEEKEIKEEKKESAEEMGKIESGRQHKQEKHTISKEKPQVHRMALQK